MDTNHRGGDRSPVVLKTACYSTFDPRHGVAVQISVGRPKWPLSYEIEGAIKELMPIGLLSPTLDEMAFEIGYRTRLDRIGADRIHERLAQVADRHGGRPLVLLCFEKPGIYCHRHAFAAWWLGETGQRVTEMKPAQIALDLGGQR